MSSVFIPSFHKVQAKSWNTNHKGSDTAIITFCGAPTLCQTWC